MREVKSVDGQASIATLNSPFPPGTESLFHMVIWPHGIVHQPKILESLFDSPDVDVLHLRTTSAEKLPRLIREVYRHDYAPLHHLASKLRYLRNKSLRGGSVTHIFFSLNDPEFTMSGVPPFRHLNSPKANEIKWSIRARFNPRKQGEMTHDHVIHLSDNPMQAINVAMYLGLPVSRGEEKPFRQFFCGLELPHHISIPKSFTVETVRYGCVRASLLRDGKVVVVPISETPHFKALTSPVDGQKIYDSYLLGMEGKELTDGHHWRTLKALYDLCLSEENFAYPPILVEPYDDGYLRILDGVHRASAALASGHKNLRVARLDYLK